MLESLLAIAFCISVLFILSGLGYLMDKIIRRNKTQQERDRIEDLEKRSEFFNTDDWPWYQQF